MGIPEQLRLYQRLFVTLHKWTVRRCCWRQHLHSSLNMEKSSQFISRTFTAIGWTPWYFLEGTLHALKGERSTPSQLQNLLTKWLACRICWWMGGIKLVRVTNQYMIWVATYSMRWNSFPMLWVLITFWYIHRPLPCSVILREASSCSRWEQIRKPANRQYVESQRHWHTQGFLHQLPHLRAQGTLQRRRKSVRARGVDEDICKEPRPLETSELSHRWTQKAWGDMQRSARVWSRWRLRAERLYGHIAPSPNPEAVFNW